MKLSKKFNEKHTFEINEYQRQYLSRLVADDIKKSKKKDYPISDEVENLDVLLLKD